ncbi:chemotaxis protein [Geobacter sp. SVR]|nr:chemotaxis protein [Geobacter sp. SVR]GCF85761.1 chemotaxis protein [Geobacter sp. SVR]
MANQLVETVSGERAHSVVARLREMIADMGAYLAGEREQSQANYAVLEKISGLLDQVSQPLEGFQKMYKVLRMLSTSTKIESARIGEKGSGFLTLAMDVEKLSHLVNDKSGNILAHRQGLITIINDDLRIVRSTESSQGSEVNSVLNNISACLEQLSAVNEQCSRSGELISSVSGEISRNIGEVVASLQAHDMTRQQIEHIVEALEVLTADYEAQGERTAEAGQYRGLVVETGDVCELQAAQLSHASAELSAAVDSVRENLLDIASKQSHMTTQTLSVTGAAGSSGHSFIEEMRRGLSAVTAVLARCAQSDRDMSATMKSVAETIGQITGFVTDIEDIGSEIDLIALNSQIKAAHTGTEGAALGVLAEAIKRLSVDAVAQTESVSQILIRINEETGHLFEDAGDDDQISAARITALEEDLTKVLVTLEHMNAEQEEQLSALNGKVLSLGRDIERTTSGINAHEKAAAMTGEVLATLEEIKVQAREREPASTEFKNNLRHLQERYTMQSERHIHEAIAKSRAGGAGREPVAVQRTEPNGSEAEFGDNVDLF